MGEAGGYGNLFVMDRQEAVCPAYTRLQALYAGKQHEELSVFKKKMDFLKKYFFLKIFIS